ncbi:hypothetical protein [Pseudoduganella sp. OTU4001]|uniref:hypothetical protein n=1 Tax=Pseudoduganella sp. OTU4001 TaxID=3043854 RepID=UPI00313E34C0
MKWAWPALLLLLAAQAGAQSFVSMGRLFTTPGERAQLDAQRSQAIQSGTGALAGVGAPAAAAEAVGAGAEPATLPGVAAPPGNAGAGRVDEAPQAAGLRLDGVIRRSNGRDVMIINGEVQPTPSRGALRGGVRLQSEGRSVTLKPGQRYDPATGAIHEAAR